MENVLKFGFKKYTFVKDLDENSKIFSRKGKNYLLKIYEPRSSEYYEFIRKTNRLENSGVKVMRVVGTNKKMGYVLKEYVEGENILDILKDHKMNEDIYKEIFILTYLAKVNKIIVSFDPSDYLWDGKKLYYISTYYSDFTKENSFIEKGIRYWFDTKELASLFNEKGIEYQRKAKEDYAVNKEIVLMTTKYYY